ncbi:MAG: beta-lactamase family protein [Myxococcaceae bacterium]|nr:beta-lactamase family protein [Myxococcaceae bacterium]
MVSSLILAAVLSATSGPAATPELQAWLSEVRSRARLPGLAVVVITAAGEVSSVTLGTDAEGAEVGPRSVFAIGSLSKSFTALGVMILVERGKLSLDQPAAALLPELDPRISIRHLLHHTSGIPGAAGFWFDGGSLEGRVRALHGEPLLWAPGTAFQYSNANYDALGLIIERVTGKPYARFMRDEVLGPMGLDQVWVRAELAEVPRGYQDWFGVYQARRDSDDWTEANTPSGGMFATAEGMGAVLRLHLTEGRSLEPTVLSEAGFGTLHRAGTDEDSSYAMGWTVRQLDGQPMIVHSGQTGEFTSTMALFPRSGFAVAALANVNALASPATRLAVRDIVPGVAQLVLGKSPKTSTWFGYRNQPAMKWLFLGIGLVSLARFAWAWRRGQSRPRWHAAFDGALAVALLVGVPWLAHIPLVAMLRFNPDLAVLLMVGAVASVVRGGSTVLTKRATPAS